VIGVAVLAGFVVQFLGWWMLLMAEERWNAVTDLSFTVGLVSVLVAVLLPFAGVGYGIYLYFTSVAADQRTVTVAFVGGLLVKTFVIPLIKAIVTGAAFRVLMRWLRGGKNTKSA
jgi:hypothetical protein